MLVSDSDQDNSHFYIIDNSDRSFATGNSGSGRSEGGGSQVISSLHFVNDRIKNCRTARLELELQPRS